MIKYYCDICKKEIKGEYDLVIDWIPDEGDEIKNLYKLQLCADCLIKIRDYIESLIFIEKHKE